MKIFFNVELICGDLKGKVMLSMAASWLMSQGERGSAGLSGLEVIAGGGGWKAVVFKLLFFGSYSVCITFNSTVIQLRILKQLIKKLLERSSCKEATAKRLLSRGS